MIYKPWWETYPGRFKEELSALEKAGIEYSVDDEAFANGVLCLNITMEGVGKLRVIFPDLYPYFRFEVYALDLNLSHHQNPFQKNLCMIGRSTENWSIGNTLATSLIEQLPKVILTGASDNDSEVEELEENQAEPFSDYYSYLLGTSIIVDGDWEIDTCYESGTLLIGTASFGAQFKGAVLEVYDEYNNILVKLDPRIIRAFSDGRLLARWVRLSDPLKTIKQGDQFKYLQEKDPSPDKIKGNRVNEGMVKIRVGLFPEEIRHRRQLDYGWIFVSCFNPRKSWVTNQIKNENEPPKNQRR